MAKVSDIISAMEALAPKNLAESWDNTGLQIGNPSDPVHKILVTLDVTASVIDEAQKIGANLIVTHHPLIFSPLKQIDSGSPVGRLAAGLVCRQIDLFVAHTNLDITAGGVNDRLAEMIGLTDTEPLQVTGREALYKLAVFVPDESLSRVRDALCGAGAGEIGDYTWCSFATAGIGSFYPKPGARPAIGKVGELEFVSEQRLEVILPESRLRSAVDAMLRAHPYEEAAYDLYRLENPGPPRGIGRVGWLAEPGTLEQVARQISIRLNAKTMKICGDPDMRIERLAVSGGSGRNMVEAAAHAGAHAFLSGDLGHHDGLAARALGVGIIDPGHYATEHPVVSQLAGYLSEALSGVEVVLSQVDTDPFRAV